MTAFDVAVCGRKSDYWHDDPTVSRSTNDGV